MKTEEMKHFSITNRSLIKQAECELNDYICEYRRHKRELPLQELVKMWREENNF